VSEALLLEGIARHRVLVIDAHLTLGRGRAVALTPRGTQVLGSQSAAFQRLAPEAFQREVRAVIEQDPEIARRLPVRLFADDLDTRSWAVGVEQLKRSQVDALRHDDRMCRSGQPKSESRMTDGSGPHRSRSRHV